MSEAELPPAALNAPFVLVVIAAHWQGQDIVRRVVELGFLSPSGTRSPAEQSSSGLDVSRARCACHRAVKPVGALGALK